jgi:hypothetical protein
VDFALLSLREGWILSFSVVLKKSILLSQTLAEKIVDRSLARQHHAIHQLRQYPFWAKVIDQQPTECVSWIASSNECTIPLPFLVRSEHRISPDFPENYLSGGLRGEAMWKDVSCL